MKRSHFHYAELAHQFGRRILRDDVRIPAADLVAQTPRGGWTALSLLSWRTIVSKAPA